MLKKEALIRIFFPVWKLRNEIYNGYLHYKKDIYRNI